MLDGKLWAVGCLDVRAAGCLGTLLSGEMGLYKQGWLRGVGREEVVCGPFPLYSGVSTGQVCVQVLCVSSENKLKCACFGDRVSLWAETYQLGSG